MGTYNVKCIIYADCLKTCSQEDIQILRKNFEQFEYADEEYSTFYCVINDKPYETLMNEYRIPYNHYWNKQYVSNAVGLDEYLTIEEIKQLHFYEYEDEHIHRIYDQERSAEIFTYCSAKDLNLVSKKLKEYLLNTDEQASKLDKKYLEELQKLELLSSIGRRYNAVFRLMPSHW